MKKIFILSIATVLSISAFCQVTSLSENFDISCTTTGQNYPLGWNEYNPIPPLATLAWNCAPTTGRYGTPGISCTGFYSGSYHLDTAWLFTPAITLSSYPDSVYLRFDSKYDVGVHKSGLTVYLFKLYDSALNPTVDTTLNSYSDLTSTLAPVISNSDSFGWVTHQLNLTPYKTLPSPTIRVAFRYVSTNSAAGAWTLDNINTSSAPLGLLKENANHNPISIAAVNNNNFLNLTYTVPSSGNYNLGIYDISGKEVLLQSINITAINGSVSANSFPYQKGIYIIKLWNSQFLAYNKLVVQ